ncbi:MAG: ABC transporter permease [Lancefieldella parvula]|uniref:ABC transporter permease n=1 Tax=Lancefieldella parvula TaxID=1382 RepID=A0A9E7AFU8_9ACTN|nr:MAG: ABC transporter permease [Lancefieldella parvula]
MSAAIFGISAPSFWVALVLQIIFALTLKWFPLSGVKTPTAYVLPVIALGSRYAASIARVTRTSMLDVLNQDYIRTAEAKGLKALRYCFEACAQKCSYSNYYHCWISAGRHPYWFHHH